MLLCLLIASEMAVLILVPVFMSARRHKQLRSHIHIRHDSPTDGRARILRLVNGHGAIRKQSTRASFPTHVGAGPRLASR